MICEAALLPDKRRCGFDFLFEKNGADAGCSMLETGYYDGLDSCFIQHLFMHCLLL